MRNSVVLVVKRGSFILTVTNRRVGGYTLPGGKIDPEDTSIENAAKRELLEETGCQTNSLQFITAIDHAADPQDLNQESWHANVFTADIGNQIPKQVEEGTLPAWQTVSQFLSYCSYKDLNQQIFSNENVKNYLSSSN